MTSTEENAALIALVKWIDESFSGIGNDARVDAMVVRCKM